MKNLKTNQNITKGNKHHFLLYFFIIVAVGILVFLFIYSKRNKEPEVNREEIIREIRYIMSQEPKEEASQQEKEEIYNQIQTLRSQQSNEN